MEVKQNAKIVVQKGDNAHEYHVPPSASLVECYQAVREMLAYLYDRLKTDFEAAQAAKTPQEAAAEPPVAPQE